MDDSCGQSEPGGTSSGHLKDVNRDWTQNKLRLLQEYLSTA